MAARAPRTQDLADFRLAVDRFERFSSDLVHLEPFSFDQVRTVVERFARDLEDHLIGVRRAARSTRARVGAPRTAAEHERFRASVEQLRGLLEVVAADDHGGHRQALGQYGRILAEALRLHLADELPGPAPAPGPRARQF